MLDFVASQVKDFQFWELYIRVIKMEKTISVTLLFMWYIYRALKKSEFKHGLLTSSFSNFACTGQILGYFVLFSLQIACLALAHHMSKKKMFLAWQQEEKFLPGSKHFFEP